MAQHSFRTPALAAFAAGRTPDPIGYLPDGRPVLPLGGGAEDAGTPGQEPAGLPSAEDLVSMTPEQVTEARERAVAESGDLEQIEDGDLTDAHVDRMEALADFIDAVDADTSRRETEQSERAQRAEAARSRLTREPEGSETEGEQEPSEGDGGEDAPAQEGEDAPAPAAAPEAVAASGSRTPAPRPARRRIQQPAAAPASRLSLTAAADVPGVSAGDTLDGLRGAAEAFVSRSRSFPQGPARAAGQRHQHGVASIRRNHDDRLRLTDGMTHAQIETVLRHATDESRLRGENGEGSLVAAGGWCAPSETLYGLTSMETLDGIIDLPTVGVDRGGIMYTPGPDFSDIYTSAGFSQTEAQAIAGDTKPCVEVDCPEFTEVRLDAVGYCVKAPLLTRTAYPEVIQRWLEGTIVANQHKIAQRLIASMRTALGTAIAPVLTGQPVTWSLLTALEMVIEGQREAYRLGEGETLEVVAPRWLRVAVRADLANRAAVGANSVSNQQIAQHFADRGARIQWVLNYLPISSNPKTVAALPATAEVMVYPAGTFVRGEADVINLDTVYDTADLQTNVYTAAFVEDGVLLAKMQHGGARITLPVNVTGQMGALDIDTSFGVAAAV